MFLDILCNVKADPSGWTFGVPSVPWQPSRIRALGQALGP